MGRFSRIICLWLTGTCGKSGRGGRSLVGEERAPDILKNQKHSKGESRVRSLRENPDTIQVCEDGIGKAKAYLDLDLVEDLEDNNKTCCGLV